MYLTKRDFPIDVDNQSTEIPGSGGVRQSKFTAVGSTSDYLFSDVKTVPEAIQRGCRASKNGPCLGWRDSDADYKWLTYEEVIQRSRIISFGLIASGLKRGQETFVAIYAQNCVEWILVEHACYSQSMVTVPLYDTLGSESIIFILNHVEAELVVCDTEKKVSSLLDAKNELPSLKHIVAIQRISERMIKLAAEKDVELHQLMDIENLGKRSPESLKLPSPLDLATVCYTSGTTGRPKGVMLSHKNMVVNASSVLKHMATTHLGVGSRHLSYLPLAHILERIANIVYLMSGASIGFFRGDIKLLSEDIRCLKPTVLITVPRVLNKIYDKVQKEVNSSTIKKYLLNTALRAKKAELERGLIRSNSVWDYLVFKNIRNALGGKVQTVLSGGAPIRDEVLTFFKCCLGCIVIETYGQTEIAGAATMSVIGEHVSGSVGPPIPSCFVKLIDVPEMNYYAKKGEGEILVKGPSVTKGYFKEPLKTAEILDDEGWLHTGDIGRWMENGSLAVIDRKKNILKLSQGEFVSPEKVEAVYLTSPYVEQIFVHGESLENSLVSIIVPQREELLTLCSQLDVKGDYEKICQNKVLINHVLKHLNKLGDEAGLKSFEQVKAIYLHPDPFSEENGLLTATMKIRRQDCFTRFKDVVLNMYRNLK